MTPKILLVDDNNTVRTLLKISLSKENYEIFEAVDGLSGYQKALEVHPDLIISDILMPNMDGFEFCRKIREGSEQRSVPFIFLSSLSEISTELRGYRTGADDYIVKNNIKKEELVEKINQLLKKSYEYSRLENKLEDGLVGRLAEMSLIEVIQILSVNNQDGILKIAGGETEGEIYFKDGQIYHAATGELSGEKAVHKMVKLENGIFRFIPEQINEEIEQTVINSAMNIIMDCCRILDEKRAGKQ